jgi:CTP:molybdopterin cytidylyltransferase MocA
MALLRAEETPSSRTDAIVVVGVAVAVAGFVAQLTAQLAVTCTRNETASSGIAGSTRSAA